MRRCRSLCWYFWSSVCSLSVFWSWSVLLSKAHGPQPHESEQVKRAQWLRQRRFGLFLCCRLVSLLPLSCDCECWRERETLAAFTPQTSECASVHFPLRFFRCVFFQWKTPRSDRGSGPWTACSTKALKKEKSTPHYSCKEFTTLLTSFFAYLSRFCCSSVTICLHLTRFTSLISRQASNKGCCCCCVSQTTSTLCCVPAQSSDEATCTKPYSGAVRRRSALQSSDPGRRLSTSSEVNSYIILPPAGSRSPHYGHKEQRRQRRGGSFVDRCESESGMHCQKGQLGLVLL